MEILQISVSLNSNIFDLSLIQNTVLNTTNANIF